MNPLTRRSLAVALAMIAAAGLAACSDDGSDAATTRPAQTATPVKPVKPTPETVMSGLVGSGCSAYAAQVPKGSGSLEGMSQDPVGTAAASNPMLTSLTAAISGKLNKKVNLLGTLNGGEFTVFAPVDAAFGKLPSHTAAVLKTNSAALVDVLTYHLIAARLDPAHVAGTQRSVQGGVLKVTGSGNDLKVNGVPVICGGLRTANATVYLIGSVLTPPK
jgi:uncharacterized surface protein with fasciclin (FAS1) repeats